MHSALRKERLSQSPDPASWLLNLAGRAINVVCKPIFAIPQLLGPFFVLLKFRQLPIIALVNTLRDLDVPIPFPGTEGELRAGVVQAASP